MESTIGLYKTELIKPGRPWRSLAQVERATAEWVDWYNHHRLHSTLGYLPPAEYESMFYAHHQTRSESPGHSLRTPPGSGRFSSQGADFCQRARGHV